MSDNTPDARPVSEARRYRWHDDGMWCLEPGEVPPTAQWVRAVDYDALRARIASLEARNASLEAAITSAISCANGRESEWGDRAEGAFAFLYAVMAPATGSVKEGG